MTFFKKNIIPTWQNLDESWRFALLAFFIARLFYAAWSWAIFAMQPVAVQNFELYGEPVLTIFKLQNSEARIYNREVQGNILTFQPAGTDHLIDQQTGSLWEISSGEAVRGGYQGAVLKTSQTLPTAIFPYHGIQPYPGRWLAMWQRFDANWYISIAEHGYGQIAGDIHFPPLYPLLMRVLGPLLGSTFLAGLVVSHLATLVLLKLLYDLFHSLGEPHRAQRACLFFVIFPTFFFFFSAYSEPVFLVAVLLALRAMKLQSWPWAGFWTFCAILIRLQGAALFAPMLFLMWHDRPFLQKIHHWMGLLIAGSSGVLYLALRSMQAGESTLPLVEANLHAHLVLPWQAYCYAVETAITGKATLIDLLNWLVTTLFIALLVWGWKRIPLEYNLYTGFSLLLLSIRWVDTQPLNSMVRYTLTLLPSFYALSVAGENSWSRRLIVYTSILLNLYLSAQFFLWGWVA